MWQLELKNNKKHLPIDVFPDLYGRDVIWDQTDLYLALHSVLSVSLEVFEARC